MSRRPSADGARPPGDGTARQIWDDTWQRLAAGTRSARHPFHLGVLATCTDLVPEVRTVVLRDADHRSHRLACHADRRSPKTRSIAANGNVAWLFYDRVDRLQLRLQCRARVDLDGAFWEERWQASRPQSRRCYTHTAAPGTPLAAPLDYGPPATSVPSDPSALDAPGRDNFAVIVTTVVCLDWLSLHHDGHRRLRFHVTPLGFDAAWIAP
jgi:hypothetical protein